MAEMKWYIFKIGDYVPLCWVENGECPCCEFDTKEDAVAFFDALQDIPFVASEFAAAEIRNCIFYYDDGKRNMSGFIPVANGDDIELKKIKKYEITVYRKGKVRVEIIKAISYKEAEQIVQETFKADSFYILEVK